MFRSKTSQILLRPAYDLVVFRRLNSHEFYDARLAVAIDFIGNLSYDAAVLQTTMIAHSQYEAMCQFGSYM